MKTTHSTSNLSLFYKSYRRSASLWTCTSSIKVLDIYHFTLVANHTTLDCRTQLQWECIVLKRSEKAALRAIQAFFEYFDRPNFPFVQVRMQSFLFFNLLFSYAVNLQKRHIERFDALLDLSNNCSSEIFFESWKLLTKSVVFVATIDLPGAITCLKYQIVSVMNIRS